MPEGVCKKCGEIRELDAAELCANCAAGEADPFLERVKALGIGQGVKIGGDLRQIRREVEEIAKETGHKLSVSETKDGRLLVVRVPKRSR
jgi:hypothetical protein